MEKFQRRRKELLEKIANICNDYARKLNKDYYVFQSSSSLYNPEILIIGINPGGDGHYKRDRTWEELESDPVTLFSKPEFEVENKLKGADFMRAKLRLLFYNDVLFEKLKNTVFTNMIFFNTKSSGDVRQFEKDLKIFCRDSLHEFIEISNPRNILFMTSSKKLLYDFGVVEIVDEDSLVRIGKLNGRKVIILPHFAARYPKNYSRENAKFMGNKLKSLLI